MKTQTPRAILSAVQTLLGGVNDLISTIDNLARSKGGKAGAVDGRRAMTPKAQAQKSAALKKAIKAHWAAMTPKERADRVRRMLKGRGLKPKKKT